MNKASEALRTWKVGASEALRKHVLPELRLFSTYTYPKYTLESLSLIFEAFISEVSLFISNVLYLFLKSLK